MPARPSSHAPYTLYTHALHTLCTRSALTRWLAACAPPGAASRATRVYPFYPPSVSRTPLADLMPKKFDLLGVVVEGVVKDLTINAQVLDMVLEALSD